MGYCYWSVSCGAQTPLRHPRTGKPDSPGASVTSCLGLVNLVLPALLTGTIDRLRFWKSQTYLYLYLLLLLQLTSRYLYRRARSNTSKITCYRGTPFFTLWVKSKTIGITILPERWKLYKMMLWKMRFFFLLIIFRIFIIIIIILNVFFWCDFNTTKFESSRVWI